VVLATREYWQGVINFEAMVKAGVIDRTDLDLFSYADDAEGVWRELSRVGLRKR
jgi:predicted Rossmann-fold nucleotide-binding protein